MKRALTPIPPTLAVDPGAGLSTSSATGIVAVVGVTPVWSTNCHRRQGEPVDVFAQRVIKKVEELKRLECPAPGWTVAVESVVGPQGHIHGRKSTVTPDQVIGISIIYAAVWAWFRGYRVRPAKAGLAHAYACDTPSGRLPCRGAHEDADHCPKEPIADYYPACLLGRRPPAWSAEVGTREHEQEAFDIAFLAWDRAKREELIA